MAREWVSRRPAVRLLEAVQEKPQRGKVLVHLPDLLFAPAAYEWETAYFHKVVSVPCVVTLTQKEFGRPASSGEQTRMKTEQTRHGVPSVSTSQLEAESGASYRPRDGPGRSGRCSIRCASSCLRTWRAAPLPARAGSPALSSEAPSVSSIDASPPSRRCATRTHRRAARREVDGGGRPPRAAGVPRQRRHREGWKCAARHTARSPSRATSGASAIASAHGSRSRAAGSAAVTHQTRATGEVATPPLGVIEGLRMSVECRSD
jgi:hypothetical protein